MSSLVHMQNHVPQKALGRLRDISVFNLEIIVVKTSLWLMNKSTMYFETPALFSETPLKSIGATT